MSRVANLLGAFALAVTDRLREATEAEAGAGAATPAALVQIGSAGDDSVEALRGCLGLSQPATSRIVERLHARGLVRRGRSTRDQRVAALCLTDAGHEIRRSILTRRRAVMEAALTGLTDADRRCLEAMLEEMLTNLVRTGGEADLTCRLCDLGDCPQERCPAEPGNRDT